MNFDQLQEELVETWFKRRPQEASYLGFTEYDTQLPSGKLSLREKEIEEDKAFLKEVQDIKEDLDFDRRITRKLIIHKLGIWLFVDETLQHYLMDPNASYEIASALNSLFLRPGPERFYPLLSRLEKTPQYVEDFKTRVVNPTTLWTEMALEAAQGLQTFLTTIVSAAHREIPSQDAEEIENCAKKVEKSLSDYKEFLTNLLPSAKTSWVMGKANFEKLLNLRKIPYTGDQILHLGKTWLKEEKEKLEKLSQLISPGKSVEEVTHLIKSRHPPTFKDVLNLYREAMRKSREFIIQNNIVTMPEGETLKVEETPPYIRYQLPLAAYMPAPAVGQRIGYYWVTPPEDPTLLTEHNEASIRNVSVHEAYPGHHIQMFCSNNHPHRIRWAFTPTDVYAKVVSEGTELLEGWAHYCEEYMVEKGFITSNEFLFMRSVWALFRAARIIVDVNLSRGDMSFDEAVTFLKKETKLEDYAALAEVKRYTLGPTYPLSYLLGKHMVKTLKKKVQKMMGPQFTDKFFHDTLLYEGTMPVALLEEIFTYRIG